MPKSDRASRHTSEPSEARRAELRALCAPAYDGPLPAGVNLFGWIMVILGLAAAALCAVFLAISIVQLFTLGPLAGERLFAAAVWLAYALFFASVWHAFRRRPDWRVALEVPASIKALGAGGAALSASLAGAALTLLLFAICAKTVFLRLMDTLGAGDVGKVQVILSSALVFSYFALVWYLFQGLTELRETARTALILVFAATALLALAAVLADTFVLTTALGNRGVRTLAYFLGGVALLGLVLDLTLVGPSAAPLFREREP